MPCKVLGLFQKVKPMKRPPQMFNTSLAVTYVGSHQMEAAVRLTTVMVWLSQEVEDSVCFLVAVGCRVLGRWVQWSE